MKKSLYTVLIVLLGTVSIHAKTELQKKTHYIRKFDLDGDGKLTLAEYTEMTRVQLEGKKDAAKYKEVAASRFKVTDKNADGFVTPEEIVRQLVKVGYIPADADTGLPEDVGTSKLKSD